MRSARWKTKHCREASANGTSTSRGYSLVELLVVLALILILAGFAAGSLLGGGDEQEAYQVTADVANLLTRARGRAIAQQKAFLVIMNTTGGTGSRGTFTTYEANGPFSRSCVNNNWTTLLAEGAGAGDAGIGAFGGLFRDKVDGNYTGAIAEAKFQFASGEASATAYSLTTPTDLAVCFDPSGTYFGNATFTTSSIVKMNRSWVRIRFRRSDDSGAVRQINLGPNGVARIDQNVAAWAW